LTPTIHMIHRSGTHSVLNEHSEPYSVMQRTTTPPSLPHRMGNLTPVLHQPCNFLVQLHNQ